MNDNDFHAVRSTGIGGSDAAAVAGIDPWQTTYELYLRKKGELAPVETTEPMRWGTLLEPVIAAEYTRRTGRGFMTNDTTWRCDKYPFMIGHIDRMIEDGRRILECKATRLAVGWGEPGTDEIPLHYSAQVHHYLVVTGVEIADIAVLIGGNDFRIYTVEADRAIAAMLIEQERLFWEMLQKGQPPAPVNVRDAVRRWGRFGVVGRVEAGAEELAAIARLRAIRDQRHGLDTDEETLKTVILTALGNNGDTLVDDTGTPLATWRIDNGRKAYSVVERPPMRRFLLKD